MNTLGAKIKKLREEIGLTQKELGVKLYVSEKTISSWENNRTTPDLDMLYKLSDYFKISFYHFISSDYFLCGENEIEIKFKLNNNDYDRVLNILNKMGSKVKDTNQIDLYYKTCNLNSDWIRIRNEDGKYVLNYKIKLDENKFKKYDVIIDNANNLDSIFNYLKIKKIGKIEKQRLIFIYKNIEFVLDDVKNLGLFLEVRCLYENNLDDIFKEITNLLNIKLNNIIKNRYIDYLY